MVRWLGLAALLAVLGIGVGRVALPYYPETEQARRGLVSTETVSVVINDWIVFEPVESASTGFVFYPGARVSPKAYAPVAHQVASAGYLVVVVPMPFHLAVLGANKAADVKAAYPTVSTWVIGGHSLGGAMASKYVFDHPTTIEGLVLWAAYPGRSHDLSTWPGDVVSISASEDGLATKEKIADSRALLPDSTSFVEIQGGNHAQFGWYGQQRGDGQAAITSEQQQDEIVEATVKLLGRLGGTPGDD